MIQIPNFDTDFKGKKFKDTRDVEFICVGYGDCQNSPYWLGVREAGQPGTATVRSILMRDATFIP